MWIYDNGRYINRSSLKYIPSYPCLFLLDAKSYDSLFKRCVGWCEGRDADPITCPVKEELVNFLADLHDKGYSYRSLNAYRSAISSTHDRVDGTTISQHPLVCRLLAGVFKFWIRLIGAQSCLPKVLL